MQDTPETPKKSITREFREFISKGNAIDLAVGMIIGSAFTAIVNSLVNSIINPFLAAIIHAFVSLFPFYGRIVNSAVWIHTGDFLGAVLRFLAIALVVFVLVKVINLVQNRAEKSLKIEKLPTKPTELELLTEIRDLLKANATSETE
ncbi:MAG: large conductance mechanosensitive channel protein MscL [Oscillospiraceae bacterium]|jgi:large conductance mechanosensitive channel|nr:large conductance mechanosensitive channel protein MscL [Oscillospiraceae bacterium]